MGPQGVEPLVLEISHQLSRRIGLWQDDQHAEQFGVWIE